MSDYRWTASTHPRSVCEKHALPSSSFHVSSGSYQGTRTRVRSDVSCLPPWGVPGTAGNTGGRDVGDLVLL